MDTGWRSRRNLKTLHSFTLRIIRERIAQRSAPGFVRHSDPEPEPTDENVYLHQGSRKRPAFMDMLVDFYLDREQHPEDQRIDIEGIREEVDTFMFEGASDELR